MTLTSMASTIARGPATSPSNVKVPFWVLSTTLALVTPGIRNTAFSMLFTHEAQVIPLICIKLMLILLITTTTVTKTLITETFYCITSRERLEWQGKVALSFLMQFECIYCTKP